MSNVLEEILAGDSLTLAGAAALLPSHRGAGRLQLSTIWRWVTVGTRAGGRIVKLEAARCGGRWLTSRAALRRYIEGLTAADPAVPPAARSGAQERAAAASAARRLAAAGA